MTANCVNASECCVHGGRCRGRTHHAYGCHLDMEEKPPPKWHELMLDQLRTLKFVLLTSVLIGVVSAVLDGRSFGPVFIMSMGALVTGYVLGRADDQ